MRDIRGDLQDRAGLLEEQINAHEAQFDKLLDQLKQEHAGVEREDVHRGVLDDPRHLVEAEARRARKQALGIAISQIAEEVRFDVGAGEEFAIDALSVEAGHRPAI